MNEEKMAGRSAMPGDRKDGELGEEALEFFSEFVEEFDERFNEGVTSDVLLSLCAGK